MAPHPPHGVDEPDCIGVEDLRQPVPVLSGLLRPSHRAYSVVPTIPVAERRPVITDRRGRRIYGLRKRIPIRNDRSAGERALQHEERESLGPRDVGSAQPALPVLRARGQMHICTASMRVFQRGSPCGPMLRIRLQTYPNPISCSGSAMPSLPPAPVCPKDVAPKPGMLGEASW
jgi:hypothetical protein